MSRKPLRLAILEAERRSRPCHLHDDRLLRRGIEPRWRDVDGLFEKRTVKWIRLVENCKRLQPAARHHAFDRKFATADKALNQDRVFDAATNGANVFPRK